MKYTTLQQEDFKKSALLFKILQITLAKDICQIYNLRKTCVIMDNQPSAISHQPSAISHQPSAISHQPTVKCELSLGSKIFGRIRSTNTYKFKINGKPTRITLSKDLNERLTELTKTPTITVNNVKITTKDVFGATLSSQVVDIDKINKNFKLATLSSIASKDDITGYDEIIKSAYEGLQAKDIADYFSKEIKEIFKTESQKKKLPINPTIKNIVFMIEKSQDHNIAISLLESLEKENPTNKSVYDYFVRHIDLNIDLNNKITFWDIALGTI